MTSEFCLGARGHEVQNSRVMAYWVLADFSVGCFVELVCMKRSPGSLSLQAPICQGFWEWLANWLLTAISPAGQCDAVVPNRATLSSQQMHCAMISAREKAAWAHINCSCRVSNSLASTHSQCLPPALYKCLQCAALGGRAAAHGDSVIS